MENKINVMIVKMGEFGLESKTETIENHYTTLQNIVGGTIAMPFVGNGLLEQGIDICINDNGKVIGLYPTFAFVDGDTVLDIIVGDCVFLSHNEDGESVSLNDNQVQYLEELIGNRAIIETQYGTFEVGVIEI